MLTKRELIAKRVQEFLYINGRIRQLPPPDDRPTIFLSEKNGPSLIYRRNGMVGELSISNRVAEELIAAGFAWQT